MRVMRQNPRLLSMFLYCDLIKMRHIIQPGTDVNCIIYAFCTELQDLQMPDFRFSEAVCAAMGILRPSMPRKAKSPGDCIRGL